MIHIGITGQTGFIGTHLFNFFGLKKDEVMIIQFRDDYFSDPSRLEFFVSKCDAVIHLAAVNRHHDPQTIYETNISLVKALINALEKTGSTPHLLFASSIQEERENVFGHSKREGRLLLADWASRNGATFTGMVIPNVFGPFGNPFYNSVIATFCHQLTHNEQPRIEVDAQLNLIYIDDLIRKIYQLVSERVSNAEFWVPATDQIPVSEILKQLIKIKDQYLENGIIPDISTPFQRNLFNTFVGYIAHSEYYPFKLKKNVDDRGSFVETVKINSGGQVSFSTTKPGITRGNHFHTRKAERFAVISGRALIQLRKVGTREILNFELDGDNPSYVDMPVWYTHNITNTGKEDLYTIFWISEFYDSADPDTFFEEV